MKINFNLGYKPKDILEQIRMLQEIFPGIGSADEKIAQQALPARAEGWFAIPRWEILAPNYGGATQKALDLLKESRNNMFHNFKSGLLGPRSLRQSQRLIKAHQEIGEQQQGHGILVFPAQLGGRYEGCNTKQAHKFFQANEFGLGTFIMSIALITHPERLKEFDDLWINCAGDEYSPKANSGFSESPCFRFNDNKIEFITIRLNSKLGFFGQASGFIPINTP